MTEHLEVGGFREWFPLRPDWTDEAFADYAVEHFTDDPAGPDMVRALAQELMVLARRNAAREDGTLRVLGAWALLPRGGHRLDVRAVASLVAARVPHGTTESEAVRLLVDDAPLYQPVHVASVETRSGTATHLRFRTYTEDVDGLDVQETIAVFWVRPENGVMVLLHALPTGDLVLASDLSDAMLALAAEVEGL